MPADRIARGVGPRWFRGVLAGIATLYAIGLVAHPPNRGVLRPLAFFTSATCLFPHADAFSIDYRLAAWSCDAHAWKPLDPRPYFPIEADDKESRFQRLAYFYKNNRTVMRALDDYVRARHEHTTDDGVTGTIGGIRIVEVMRPLPAVGETFPRYVFEPLAELPPPDLDKDPYYASSRVRRERCKP